MDPDKVMYDHIRNFEEFLAANENSLLRASRRLAIKIQDIEIGRRQYLANSFTKVLDKFYVIFENQRIVCVSFEKPPHYLNLASRAGTSGPGHPGNWAGSFNDFV